MSHIHQTLPKPLWSKVKRWSFFALENDFSIRSFLLHFHIVLIQPVTHNKRMCVIYAA